MRSFCLAFIVDVFGGLRSHKRRTRVRGTLFLIAIPKHTTNAVLQDEVLEGTSHEVAAGLPHVSIIGLKAV